MKTTKNLIWETLSGFFGSWLIWLVKKALIVLMSAIFGAFIGLFMKETILGILKTFGITGYSMWQIGGFFGFIGSSVNMSIQNNNERFKVYP